MTVTSHFSVNRRRGVDSDSETGNIAKLLFPEAFADDRKSLRKANPAGQGLGFWSTTARVPATAQGGENPVWASVSNNDKPGRAWGGNIAKVLFPEAYSNDVKQTRQATLTGQGLGDRPATATIPEPGQRVKQYDWVLVGRNGKPIRSPNAAIRMRKEGKVDRSHANIISFYVTNFPGFASRIELERIFNGVAPLIDLYMPIKRNKQGVGVGEDVLLWGSTTGVKYTVRLGKASLSEMETQSVRWIRRKEVPLKVNIFLWRLLKDRLPTYENLWRRKAISTHYSCPLCQTDAEDGWHAMYACHKVKRAWLAIFEWWHIGFVEIGSLPTLVGEMFTVGQAQGWNRSQQMGWECTVMATAWCIWRNRNSLIFSNQEMSIIDETKISSYEWVKNRTGLKKLSWVDWFREPTLAVANLM